MKTAVLRRLTCLLLAAALTLGLAGCGDGGIKEAEDQRYEGEENMTFEELLELDRQNPITIQIMLGGETEVSSSDSAVLQAIAEKTGVTIELIPIDTDRLQMLLASKEYPDAIVMNRDATFYDYLDSGDLVDLGELFKRAAPTVYEMNSELIPLFTNEDGELLYMTENDDLLREGERHPEDATDPTRQQQERPWHSVLYVQYPLVKEVYGHAITSFEEYREALDAFLAADDGSRYAIAFDKESAGDILWAGLSMYGYKCIYRGGLYVTADGENYTYGLKAEKALDWLLFMNELYREGYIWEDAPVASYDQFIRQMNRGNVFSFVGNYYAVGQANKTLLANGSDISYIPQQMKAPGVDQVWQYNAAYTGSGAFVIPKTTPYKTRIARLLEWLYSDEGSIIHGWGIEGEDYIINEDGLRDLNAEIAAKKNDTQYDLQRGIRALYGVINLPTFTTDGQPAFARYAPYLSSGEGADPRDVIVTADPEFNWHDDWMGTFWNDLTELDIEVRAETDAAIAAARCTSVIKDLINNIIMAPSEEECRARYQEAVERVNSYGIEAWEENINEQIHARREAQSAQGGGN